jgi:hypothetical protein
MRGLTAGGRTKLRLYLRGIRDPCHPWHCIIPVSHGQAIADAYATGLRTKCDLVDSCDGHISHTHTLYLLMSMPMEAA